MAVEYDMYTIPHPNGDDNEEILHVRIAKADTVTTDILADEIEYGSSLTSGDVTSTVSLLSNRMAVHIRNGRKVHIEGLGYFQLSITVSADKNKKKMRSDYIRVRGINFRPDKRFMNKIKDVEFVRKTNAPHSQKLEHDEVLELLKEHFENRPIITRAEFQELCRFTKSMALKWINILIKEGVLVKTGYANSSVYEWRGKG